MLNSSKTLKEVKKDFESMHAGVTAAFTQVKDELTEHLDAINQNTSEFEIVHQRLNQLEAMIEKLAERIDEFSVSKTSSPAEIVQEKIILSLREQEFFLSLYTSTEIYSASEYARYLGLTDELIHALAHKLIGKGVPVLTSHDEIGRVCYELENNFKELQAKQGMVVVHPSVLEQFSQKEDDIDYS